MPGFPTIFSGPLIRGFRPAPGRFFSPGPPKIAYFRTFAARTRIFGAFSLDFGATFALVHWIGRFRGRRTAIEAGIDPTAADPACSGDPGTRSGYPLDQMGTARDTHPMHISISILWEGMTWILEWWEPSPPRTFAFSQTPSAPEMRNEHGNEWDYRHHQASLPDRKPAGMVLVLATLLATGCRPAGCAGRERKRAGRAS